jgi:glycosyltransferase involved in cell wall biosynthesis
LNSCQRFVSDLGLANAVFFVGQKRVNGRFLSGFDLFVFSSLADTFGIALLEAMACGLPVLVSDIPSSMELIGHGKHGLYFETGNAHSCADGILRFMKDQNLRKTMGEKAYLRSHNFTPEKIVHDLEMIYLDTMGLNMK